MFSKTCKYGIKAVLYIAAASLKGTRVKVGDIVKDAGVPKAFTGKILGELARSGIVNSFTGPNGGFEMDAEKIRSVRVSNIVTILDGDDVYKTCVLGLEECNEDRPCAMHHKMVGVKQQLRKVLENTSIYELVKDAKAGNSFLNSL